jgi:hypothetical protein
MTDTKVFDVSGAKLTVTVRVMTENISINMSIDTANLDADEPEHGDHNIIKYVDKLINWEHPKAYWWCRRCRKQIIVKTGSQAKRVIYTAIPKLSDVISSALLDRNRRKAEINNIF